MAWKQHFKIKKHGRKQGIGVIVELFNEKDIIRSGYMYFHMPMSDFNSLTIEEKEKALKDYKFYESNYKDNDNELLIDHIFSRTYVCFD